MLLKFGIVRLELGCGKDGGAIEGARTPRSCDRLNAATDRVFDSLRATVAGDDVTKSSGVGNGQVLVIRGRCADRVVAL